MNKILFNQAWLDEAKENISQNSWAYNVLSDIKGNGAIYLSQLNEWYSTYPFTSKGKKKHLKHALESLANEDHLGAVNEICWYRFLQSIYLNPEPLAEGKIKTPDFKVTSSDEQTFFCEVTTLNTSHNDLIAYDSNKSVTLRHDIEILRIFRKAVEEKAEQLSYGQQNQQGSVFVIFDYSTFSGLGTKRHLAIADALLQNPEGLNTIPSNISAIIYIERYINEGKSRINTSQSAVYHNPLVS